MSKPVQVDRGLWIALREALATIAFPGEGDDPKPIAGLALEAMREVDRREERDAEARDLR